MKVLMKQSNKLSFVVLSFLLTWFNFLKERVKLIAGSIRGFCALLDAFHDILLESTEIRKRIKLGTKESMSQASRG